MEKSGGRLINIGLRTATLCAKFLFIFFLAKYLSPASIGYYGLFTATVGYCLYFVGLDFYTYSTREVLKTPNDQRGRLLKGQAMLSGVLYLILLPVAFVLLQFSGWPEPLVLWFFPILILEHFNQEIFRLLVAVSEQITASLILFIRQGSWAMVVVALMAWDTSSRHLQTVLICWSGAGLAAAMLGMWRIKHLRMGGWQNPIDWRWIKKGIVISAGFLVATLALRAVQTLDRYWLEALVGIDLVGAYVLFLGVASTLMIFLDAGVFAYAYPELIKLHQQRQYQAAQQKIKVMLVYTLVFAAGFSLVSWLLLPYLLDWISNPLYSQVLRMYPWLLLAMVINAVSMVPHFALYATGNDRPIIFSHMAALGAFTLTVWIVAPHWQMLAVPAGLNVSFTVILVWKSIAYRYVSTIQPDQKGTLKTI